LTLSLVHGDRKDSIGLYGLPGMSKSAQIQLGFERCLFIGRSMDLHSVAKDVGAHPGVSLPAIYQQEEPKEWTLGAMRELLGFIFEDWNSNTDGFREFMGEYDCLLIDDLSLQAIVMPDIIEEEIAQIGAAHPLATKNGKPNTWHILGAIGKEMMRLCSLGGKLPMSFAVVCHEREACTNTNGDAIKGAPQMPTKNLGPKIQSLFSTFPRVANNPDFMDPWSSANAAYSCSFFADSFDPDWASRDRSGVIKGHGPSDLWSVLEHAGIRHRRAKGREFLDDFVLQAANQAVKICGEGASFANTMDAKKQVARWITKQNYASKIPADAPSSVPRDWRLNRLIFQQGFGYAYYAEASKTDPLDFDLPDASVVQASTSAKPKGGLALPPPSK
jgi:hypothetical protein